MKLRIQHCELAAAHALYASGGGATVTINPGQVEEVEIVPGGRLVIETAPPPEPAAEPAAQA